VPAADWFAERVNNSWNQSHSMESECVAASEAEVKRESQIEFKKIVVRSSASNRTRLPPPTCRRNNPVIAPRAAATANEQS
jgi:hypothetical protein